MQSAITGVLDTDMYEVEYHSHGAAEGVRPGAQGMGHRRSGVVGPIFNGDAVQPTTVLSVRSRQMDSFDKTLTYPWVACRRQCILKRPKLQLETSVIARRVPGLLTSFAIKFRVKYKQSNTLAIHVLAIQKKDHGYLSCKCRSCFHCHHQIASIVTHSSSIPAIALRLAVPQSV